MSNSNNDMAATNEFDPAVMIAKYETGQRVARELAKMPTPQLKKKLLSILSDQPSHIKSMLEVETSGIRKTYMDDEVEKIEVCYYDSIVISSAGIYFHPEHRAPERLVSFNEHFKL